MADVSLQAIEATGIQVEVMLAWPDHCWRKALVLPAGATVADALAASGVAAEYPDLFSEALSVGIYGVACPLTHTVSPADRIEIYRPLQFDPKESRRRRAPQTGAKAGRKAGRRAYAQGPAPGRTATLMWVSQTVIAR
ncbi:RnfH family protein [Neopusillimonas aromaticivorans]|uniref:RnfH family protein n=1 Tax=Neopusillimonas aromaticivorans TaxID=2979868 RepID=UPI0025981062|nr:RnfH family protein [Neopusillimonas aromaticivorans]WJJ93626.1 RnfH family protein [Neopusillimonas aromaticivorans]